MRAKSSKQRCPALCILLLTYRKCEIWRIQGVYRLEICQKPLIETLPPHMEIVLITSEAIQQLLGNVWSLVL